MANEYRVQATVAGIAADGGSITFELPKSSNEFLEPSSGCTLDEDVDVMDCPVASGATTLSVQFLARLPAGRGGLMVSSGERSVTAAIVGASPAEARLRP